MTEIELEAGPPEAPVRVIINSDGELIFPNEELEYDMAFAAMGGAETSLIKLAKHWEKYPIQAIVGEFGVPEPVKQFLLIDMAEHVLPLLEKTVHPRRQKLARRTIRQLRMVAAGDRSTETTGKLSHLVDMMTKSKTGETQTTAVRMAVRGVMGALYYAYRRLNATVVFTNFNPCCDAAAYHADSHKDSPAWKQAYREEELWEIAHFVDLMKHLCDAVRDKSRSPHK